jgi:hypothetical protein
MAKEVKRATKKAAATRPLGIVRPTPAKDAPCRRPSDEQIRLRAYQIFLARDGAPGDAFSDWTQAERELMEELAR